ncbi:FAD/FMN-containing dehydrogenase [Novosphingobium chloroacetimidivorans]|uniref:FAD/FMN-containing dehydrogenase n=1 Tax=Novosphingobium chloroacetimidivorans TaxID=1428314 RepID=A0A7W7K717_9SPHN|nr:FAD-binding oxidoreductase [Novosphingobium chloroacetimidivorans]MBB4857432.1 FAD/FMN-containing dehydrogenase [Novosphingobium chloroacetimidivorans]
MKLSGWGRHPVAECEVVRPRDPEALRQALAVTSADLIARGNGRAYGDSALNPARTIDMRGFDRILGFDSTTGQVIAEAGVLLADLIEVFLPRGWFPAVTPGTKFVSIGGAIASDVHGKNHHAHGSFGQFVDWIDVLGPDGVERRASRDENAELFAWTVGGMGLTGVILRAGVRLTRVETGWIRQTMLPAPDLATAMDLFERGQDATYSVGWIDCLATGRAMGRSLVMLGEHATLDELGEKERQDRWVQQPKRKKAVPLDFPSFALNSVSVRAFNTLYYANGRRQAGSALIDYDSYFYPLDAILEWNRIYGRKGFAQFQCVIPLAASMAGLTALLGAIARSGQGSFLAVLKRMGAQESRFSFPMEGYTLALDFPMRQDTPALFAELEAIAIDHGGRFYLAKDSLLTPERLRRSDGRTAAFTRMREASGADARFRSLQSERLRL